VGAAVNFSPLNIPVLLRKHAISPNKGLGQNFLVDENYLEQIASAAEISTQDSVLEVGAGIGNLTLWLAQTARQVVAVEKDLRLIPILKEVIGSTGNVRIVAGDILQLDPQKLMVDSGYIAAANIPYYITSALFRHLLEAPLKPSRMVLTIQGEVAKRICAKPGKLSLLALSVQVYGKPQIVLEIPASAFYPQPRVNSAMLRVDLYPQPLIPTERLDEFFRLIKAGFSQKRKMLHNALSAGLAWPKEQADELLTRANVEPQRRAQTLSMDEWRCLTEIFHENQTGVI
jgi:16S rRNA (adenine1518-N6/adenine1519-N6)-dimethyltransferase